MVTVGGVASNGVSFTVAAAALPSPWLATDIGSPAVGGSATYASGTFTLNGAGADIWGTADQFHFAYRMLTGDGEIIAQVASLQNTNGWAKAGVMMRETLGAGSRNAFVAVTPANGLAFQRRVTTGGASATTVGGAGTAPSWVRLVRSGSTVSAYRSTTGISWTLIGSDTIFMGATVYVGLAVTSHNVSTRAMATFVGAAVVIATGPPSPSITNLMPTSGAVGTAVTITGMNFGTTQGTSTVRFNGTDGHADKLERDEHCGAGAKWRDHGDRGGDGRRGGEQRDEFHGGGSAEHHEPDADVGGRGNGGDDRGDEFRGDAGDEHGPVQRDGGHADELERDQHCGAGAKWRDHGDRGGDGRRGAE